MLIGRLGEMRFLFTFLSLIEWVSAVNKADFHTCEQSKFCAHHRQFKSEVPFLAEIESARLDNGRSCWIPLVLAGDDTFNSSFELKVSCIVTSIDDAIYRVQIFEKHEKRFEIPSYVLRLTEGYTNGLLHVKKIAEKKLLVWCDGCGNSVVIHANPFSIDLIEGREEEDYGRALISINNAGKLLIENDNGSLGVDVKFTDFDRVYGIPEHADSLSLRNTLNSEPYRLFNLDVFEYELESRMALYGSIPLMYAHSAKNKRTVAVFWLNAAEAWIDIDSNINAPLKPASNTVVNHAIHSMSEWLRHLFGGGGSMNKVVKQSTRFVNNISTHWMFETGSFDMFLISSSSSGSKFKRSSSPLDIIRQYCFLTGTHPLPPLSSIGYHQSRWSYMSEEEVRNVERKFDELNIPLDHIWLDIDYADGIRYFTWNKNKFPNPKLLIDYLRSKNRALISIIDPHIKLDHAYSVYEEAKKNGFFVKTADGSSDFEGNCWPGKSSYIDFLNPEAGKWYASQYSNPNHTVTQHTWNDMNEPSVFNSPEITFPRDVLHHGSVKNRDLHNLYGFLMSKYSAMGQCMRSSSENEIEQRSFLLTRAFFAGSQRYSAVWTGDNSQSWEHLRASIPMILSLSISGIGFSGADVGGFFDGSLRDHELYTRWHQLGSLFPFYRTHSHKESQRKEPWGFDDLGYRTSYVVGRQIERRYLFAPYIYTLFRLQELYGDPIVRPLWFGFPGDENVLDTEDAFMIGDSIIVYPVLHSGKSHVDFYVPHSDDHENDGWLSMLDMSVYMTSQWYREPAPLDGHATVLIKLGTVLPFKFRPRRSLLSTRGDPITLFVCPNSQGKAEGELYVDNGEDVSYRTQSKFIHRKFIFENNILKSIQHPQYTAQNYSTSEWIERFIFCNHGPVVTSVKINISSKLSKSLDFEQTNGKYGNHLLVRRPGIKIERDFTLEIIH